MRGAEEDRVRSRALPLMPTPLPKCAPNLRTIFHDLVHWLLQLILKAKSIAKKFNLKTLKSANLTLCRVLKTRLKSIKNIVSPKTPKIWVWTIFSLKWPMIFKCKVNLEAHAQDNAFHTDLNACNVCAGLLLGKWRDNGRISCQGFWGVLSWGQSCRLRVVVLPL